MTVSHFKRILLASSAGLGAMMIGGVAQAQQAVAPDVSVNLPLLDICAPPSNTNSTQCSTPVRGTRSVAVASNSTTIVNSVRRTTGAATVNFDGLLQIEGIRLLADPQAASLFLSRESFDGTTVDLTTQYTANFDFNTVNGISFANPGYSFSNIQSTVRAINVGIADQEYESASGFGTYNISAVDPTAVTNNSVVLTGGFQSDAESSGALVFGTITGTATLREGTLTSSDLNGINPGGSAPGGTFLSPYALEIAVTPTVTTQLDASGLTTPTISVTQGINLNGSRITNLGAGVAPTDAVNKAQLDALIQQNAAGALTLGAGANASGADSVAIGSGAIASNGAAVSIGLANQASGNGAVAIGDPNIATGQGAVAVGANNTATGQGAVAVGNLSVANGNSTVALGDAANAGANGAIALGQGAIAAQANAVALGTAATTTRAGQVALGGTGSSVRVGDVAASTAAQSGPIDIVTVDASGTIGRDTSIRSAIVAAQGSASAISAIQALDVQQSSRIGALEAGQVSLNQQVAGNHRAANGGIAAAMALGGTILPANASYALSFNLATYRGQQGFSGSAVIRVSEKVYFNAGVAGSTVGGSTGGRAGVTFAW